MDNGVTGILLAHPLAFGSGELKTTCESLKAKKILYFSAF